MELLRITRQIHRKAIEQRATLIHRQYNRDWGTSYSRPPYLTPPPCYKILAAPLLSSEGRRSAGGAQGPNAGKDGTGWSLPPSSRRGSDEAVVAVASSVDEPCAAAAGGCLRSSSSAGRASPATAISPRPSRPSSRQTPPPTCLQHATPPHHHRLTLHGCSR